MSLGFSVSLEITGMIDSENVLEGLCKAIAADAPTCSGDKYIAIDTEEAALRLIIGCVESEQPLCFEQTDRHEDDFPEIISFCAEHGISVIFRCDADPYCASPAYRMYMSPELNEGREIIISDSDNCEPSVPTRVVSGYLREGKHEMLKKLMEDYTNPTRNMPSVLAGCPHLMKNVNTGMNAGRFF